MKGQEGSCRNEKTRTWSKAEGCGADEGNAGEKRN